MRGNADQGKNPKQDRPSNDGFYPSYTREVRFRDLRVEQMEQRQKKYFRNIKISSYKKALFVFTIVILPIFVLIVLMYRAGYIFN